MCKGKRAAVYNINIQYNTTNNFGTTHTLAQRNMRCRQLAWTLGCY